MCVEMKSPASAPSNHSSTQRRTGVEGAGGGVVGVATGVGTTVFFSGASCVFFFITTMWTILPSTIPSHKDHAKHLPQDSRTASSFSTFPLKTRVMSPDSMFWVVATCSFRSFTEDVRSI